jgi:hypothetical protein
MDIDLTQEHLPLPEFQRWASDLRNTYGIALPYQWLTPDEYVFSEAAIDLDDLTH